MGGGNEFQALVQRKNARRERLEQQKLEERNMRLAQYHAREAETIKVFKDMLSQGGPVRIAPREPQ